MIGCRNGSDFGVNAAGSAPDTSGDHYAGPLLLFVVFMASAIIFFFGPNFAAGWLPRALIVPVVLGGWLPLLTWLSAHGRRLRAPLISGGFLLLAIVSGLFGDNHSVRGVLSPPNLLHHPRPMLPVRRSPIQR